MLEMRSICRCCVAVGLVMAALSAPSPAQPQQRNIRWIVFVRLKPDRTDDWKAGAKEYAALMKKSGVDQGFTVWSAESGPNQYAVVWYFANWKELDQEEDPKTKAVGADIARVFGRLNGATISAERAGLTRCSRICSSPARRCPRWCAPGGFA